RYNASEYYKVFPGSRAMFTRRNVLLMLVIAALATVIGYVGCSPADDPWGGKPAPHILVTVPPLYSFAKNVAGDHGDVKCLCTTSGPHQFVADTTHTRMLRGASRFFAVGLGLDDKFTDPMMKATGTNADVLVELGKNVPDKQHPRVDEGDHGDKEEHGDYDPHVWLGTPQATAMVEQIRDELKKVDAA